MCRIRVLARGKCCANSRVDSKIELPTSGSGYREMRERRMRIRRVYTHSPAFVIVCTRETAPMNEPARVSPRDLLLSTWLCFINCLRTRCHWISGLIRKRFKPSEFVWRINYILLYQLLSPTARKRDHLFIFS